MDTQHVGLITRFVSSPSDGSATGCLSCFPFPWTFCHVDICRRFLSHLIDGEFWGPLVLSCCTYAQPPITKTPFLSQRHAHLQPQSHPVSRITNTSTKRPSTPYPPRIHPAHQSTDRVARFQRRRTRCLSLFVLPVDHTTPVPSTDVYHICGSPSPVPVPPSPYQHRNMSPFPPPSSLPSIKAQSRA